MIIKYIGGNTLLKNDISIRALAMISSATAEMDKKAEVYRKAGEKVISLLQGEPDFDSPEVAKEAVYKALENGENHYTPADGLLELKAAIAEKVKRENRIEVDKTNVIVTNGSYQALFLAMMALINPGDEILSTDPGFTPYQNIIRLAGGKPILVPATVRNKRYTVLKKDWEAAITKKTKALILNNPWNPTGAVLTQKELEEIADLAIKNGLYIIVDEIYEKIIFSGHEHKSIASLAPEVRDITITVNGFSKAYAMTGWRLGYAVAKSELIQFMKKINHCTSRCATVFVQRAGLALLKDKVDYCKEMVNSYEKRKDIMIKKLNSFPHVNCLEPEGTFYVFADFSYFGMESHELANLFLDKAKVITSPGSYYGKRGEGFLRFSCATSEELIIKALDRIKTVVSTL